MDGRGARRGEGSDRAHPFRSTTARLGRTFRRPSQQTLTERLSSGGAGGRRSRRPPIPVVLALVIVLVVGAGLGAVALALRVLQSSTSVEASSTALGTNADELLTAPETGARSTTWRSMGEAVGSTLTVTWPRDTAVSRVSWRAPRAPTIASMRAVFSDGSTLLLTADGRTGDLDVSFPQRDVRSLRLVVATVRSGADEVSLSALRAGTAASVPTAAVADLADREVTATASSSSESASALVDGSRDGSDADSLGGGWTPASTDQKPWVELSWPTPRQVTSVQLFGPGDGSVGPKSGSLRFSDGSTLVVGAVRGDDAPATTVGFAPRMVKSVRFTMDGPNDGLREFRAFGVGQSPPTSSEAGASGLTVAEAADCSGTSAPTRPPSTLALLCPLTGTSVDGQFSIAVAGPAGRSATLSAFQPFPGDGASAAGATEVVQRTTSSKAGLVRFSLDSSKLPSGPVNLSVAMSGVDGALAVQVLNEAGRQVASQPAPKQGRTLLWQDDFDGPLSSSVTGATTTYAATKPEFGGPAGFGDAIFADPAWKTGNLGTVDGYLRLRLSPKGDLAQAKGDSRKQLGAIISSSAVGGGGTSAQYGYFEARVLGAPGTGTWPAFWTLTNPSLVGADGGAEVDAVELYGRDTATACHAVHTYPGDKATIKCSAIDPPTNWSMQWHTYGVDIGPEASRYYVDGQLVETLKGPAYTDESFFFMLNLASGGGWPVDLSPTKGVADMYVDWVRVWS